MRELSPLARGQSGQLWLGLLRRSNHPATAPAPQRILTTPLAKSAPRHTASPPPSESSQARAHVGRTETQDLLAVALFVDFFAPLFLEAGFLAVALFVVVLAFGRLVAAFLAEALAREGAAF